MINGSPLSYLWIDGLEARLVLVHLEVELGVGDGQGAFHHHGRSHKMSAGAEVHWACGNTRTALRQQAGRPAAKVNLEKPPPQPAGTHRRPATLNAAANEETFGTHGVNGQNTV